MNLYVYETDEGSEYRVSPDHSQTASFSMSITKKEYEELKGKRDKILDDFMDRKFN